MASAEVGTISAVIHSGDWLALANAGITYQMFHEHKAEAKWLHDYYRQYRQTPSVAEMRSQFPKLKLEDTSNVAGWADQLREHHARQVTLDVFDKTSDLLEKGTAIKALEYASANLTAALNRVHHSSVSYTSDYDTVLAEAERRQAERQRTGAVAHSWPWKTLQRTTGGAHGGHLTVMGARLGIGKTWGLLRCAAQWAYEGGRPLFISLEQSEVECTFRLHSLLSYILMGQSFGNSSGLINGTGNMAAYRQFLDKMDQELEGHVLIADGSRSTTTVGGVGALVEAHQPTAVIVDYLTLMEMDGSADDHRAIGKLTRGLKLLAGQYDIPFLVAAQLNREAEGFRDPTTANLARSDSIGQDADLVVMLQKRTPSVRQLSVAKYRHGDPGPKIFLQFQPGDGLVEEVTGDKANQLMDEDAGRDDE